MTAKYIRIAAVAGALAVAGVVLTACSDSSTASAPIGTEPVTTTTMSGTEHQSSSESLKSTTSSADATQRAKDAASKASTSLPATKPNSSKPDDFPGDKNPPANVKLSDKDKAYLRDLKRQNVSFMGDDDNNVALTMGHYVCDAREQKADPMLVKAYVRAAIGPMTKTEAEANTKSDKVISAAEKNLC